MCARKHGQGLAIVSVALDLPKGNEDVRTDETPWSGSLEAHGFTD